MMNKIAKCLVVTLIMCILSYNFVYATTGKGTVTDDSVWDDCKQFVEKVREEASYEESEIHEEIIEQDLYTEDGYLEKKVNSNLKLRYEREAKQKVVYIYQLWYDGYVSGHRREACMVTLGALEREYDFDLDINRVRNEYIKKEQDRRKELKIQKEREKELKYHKGKDRLSYLGLLVLVSWRERGWGYSQETNYDYYPGLDIRMDSNDSTSYKIRSDCSGFIGTVLREYGIKLFQEQSFQDIMKIAHGLEDVGTTFIVEHLEDLKTDPKIEVLDFDIEKLEFGDIMIRMPGQVKGYDNGHVEIFLGPINQVAPGTDLTTVDMGIINWGSNRKLNAHYPIKNRDENSTHNWIYDYALAASGEDYPYMENSNPYEVIINPTSIDVEHRKIARNQYVYIIRVHDENEYPMSADYELKWSK